MAQPDPGPPSGAELPATTREAVLALAAAATAADGARPLSEATLLRLRGTHPGVRHLAMPAPDADGQAGLGGYAQIDEAGVAELVVHPAHRGRGLGETLLGQLLDAAPPTGLHVWSYAGHPAASALAEKADLVPVRELWRMRRALPLAAADDPPGPVPLPPGVQVRTFVVGQDEAAWLALNAAAFAAHGEQGRLTRADLDARIAADWFDPAGFFLAERVDARGRRLVGFHWTKQHAATATEPAAGEIYVLGVDPAEHGGGLGRSLSRLGLRHLAAQGLSTVLLYVDADNVSAVAVYRRLGFATEAVSVMYGR